MDKRYAKEMIKLVCMALIKVEIEWQFDPKEMKIKCRTKVDDEKLWHNTDKISTIAGEILSLIKYLYLILVTI